MTKMHTDATAEGLLRAALEEIANPIAAMQRRADADGAHLIGHQAQTLSNDANYLKSIARAAIRARTPKES